MDIQQLQLVISAMSQGEQIVLIEVTEALIRTIDKSLKLIKLSRYTYSYEVSFPEMYVGLDDNYYSYSKRSYEQSAGRFRYFRVREFRC